MTTQAESLYTSNVVDATKRFLDAVNEAPGWTTNQVEHPLAGPHGEPLVTVVARRGALDAENVLVMISGTHGIEGYAGSALQIGAVRNNLLPLRSDWAVVMVHLVNPWGTAWSARENEHNVELLRHPYHLYVPATPNPDFARFHEILRLSEPGTIDDFFQRLDAFPALLAEVPPDRLNDSLIRGQASHPDGITFVGGSASWSTRLLTKVLEDHATTARRLVILDLHSGSGPPGETVAMSMTTGSHDRAHHELLTSWFGPLWPSSGDAPVWAWPSAVLPQCHEVLGVVFEAGTEILEPHEQYIFPLDVWMRHYATSGHPDAQQHLDRYRRFFYPEQRDWYRAAWASGSVRLRQLARGLESLPPPMGGSHEDH